MALVFIFFADDVVESPTFPTLMVPSLQYDQLPDWGSADEKLLPLKEDEISILYYLIATKLCISVCNSAHSRKINPDNK